MYMLPQCTKTLEFVQQEPFLKVVIMNLEFDSF